MPTHSSFHRRSMGVAVVCCLPAACGPGPASLSAETLALEPYVPSADDLGAGYRWREGGQVSTDVGHLCPGADVSIGSIGALRAWFTKPSGAGELSVEEFLWADGPGELDRLMSELTSACSVCDGVEWDSFGEKLLLELIETPSLGDERIAVRQLGPSSEEVSYRLYVRNGSAMVLILTNESMEVLGEVGALAVAKLRD